MNDRAYTRHMATTTRRSQTARASGRFRWRTQLRGLLPERLGVVVPKGASDCGAHEFYNHDGVTDRCYHCSVGERPHQSVPLDREEREILVRAAVAGSSTARDVLAERR